MRTLLSLIALLALAVPAGASTKVKANLVPTPPDCFGGEGLCLNNGNSCSDPSGNSDCTGGGLSPKSSVSLDGRLRLIVSLRDVRNPSGVPVTTGPLGAADNYILDLEVRGCLVDVGEIPYCSNPTAPTSHLYIKIPLVNGKGTTRVSLAPVVASAAGVTTGGALHVQRMSLVGPQTPCPGTNSAADILARVTGSQCNNGVEVVAVDGVVVE